MFKEFIIFSLGAAIGSLVTCRLVYDKARAEADAEIKDMRDFYMSNQNKDILKEDEETEEDDEEEDIVDDYDDDIEEEIDYIYDRETGRYIDRAECESPSEEGDEEIWFDPTAPEEPEESFQSKIDAIVEREGYKTNEPDIYDREELKEMGIKYEPPYVITFEDFEEYYRSETLSYWTDGIVTDLHGNIVHNHTELLGEDILGFFGEFEDEDPNIAYVRNDKLQMDYEILREPISYHSLGK